ncbi:MAG TPA: DUF1385 domain-containing protein [Aliicoccus persicus]|uniref:DUF1385 domain-containing protein n=1 Tax=Aliicoccus persicus TaxID=930138 RepID=A0A921B559_9STAP|nr:DUF1385 domain-containing protein [Aliicoccus persicus]
MTKNIFGGQAVPEGVMFQNKEHMVTAIRRTDDSIDYFHMEKQPKKWVNTLKKIPIVRGNVALIEAAIYGSKHMDFAADRYERDPADDVKIAEEKQKENLAKMVLFTVVVAVVSFLIGQFIFTLIPAFVAHMFGGWVTGTFGQVSIETLFKLVVLLGYIYVLSLTPMVKRLFQYHGAEHKVINAYENGYTLTIDNVMQASRLHYRCGSSFILFTVLVSFVLYMFVPYEPLYVRILNRIALIPLVLGFSFEVLQITNKLRNIPVLKYLALPGLWLQLLTTKEPQPDQVDVAIHSFNRLVRKVEQ